MLWPQAQDLNESAWTIYAPKLHTLAAVEIILVIKTSNALAPSPRPERDTPVILWRIDVAVIHLLAIHLHCAFLKNLICQSISGRMKRTADDVHTNHCRAPFPSLLIPIRKLIYGACAFKELTIPIHTREEPSD